MEPGDNLSLKETEDGSFTLYMPEFSENTHTIHGAYGEAIHKHIIPSGISDIEGGCITVLDVGFGLGYNILALLMSVDFSLIESLQILSFEKERSIASSLQKIEFNDERDKPYSLIKKAFYEGSAKEDKVSIELCFGDARKNIKLLELLYGTVDVIFHDPHSPGKNSELWTVNFFKNLYLLLKPGGILTTYSFAPQIRMGLLEADFSVAPFISDQFSKEGTCAKKGLLNNCFSSTEISALKNDYRSEPYYDNEDLSLSREKIRLNRVESVRLKKQNNKTI
ncbi:MAG: MnmC family methyltransferase [Spirochaetes bacterium]|jgi:tRNA U34 5-methylaminomethyl-2-thiouridine-forming methyltransferase MnmC|nr:MnmC family methyltransferase [Spirochaetota bacterium]